MKTISINDEDYNIIKARAKEDGRTLAGFIHVLLLPQPAQTLPTQTFSPVNVPNLMDDNQLQQYITEQLANRQSKLAAPYKPVPQPEMSEAELKRIIAARSAS